MLFSPISISFWLALILCPFAESTNHKNDLLSLDSAPPSPLTPHSPLFAYISTIPQVGTADNLEGSPLLQTYQEVTEPTPSLENPFPSETMRTNQQREALASTVAFNLKALETTNALLLGLLAKVNTLEKQVDFLSTEIQKRDDIPKLSANTRKKTNAKPVKVKKEKTPSPKRRKGNKRQKTFPHQQTNQGTRSRAGPDLLQIDSRPVKRVRRAHKNKSNSSLQPPLRQPQIIVHRPPPLHPSPPYTELMDSLSRLPGWFR